MKYVTEHELGEFRSRHLTPQRLLRLIDENVHSILRLSVGVGKTWALGSLLVSPDTYSRFDLVIYVAPRWDILNEVVKRVGAAPVPPSWKVLRARPRTKCGNLDDPWSEYERRSCGALAKEELCGRCPRSSDCDWPNRLKDLYGVDLFLTAEKQLELNRALISLLKSRTQARRALVILDEGKLLDANFELVVTREELARFREALVRARCDKRGWPEARQESLAEIDRLMSMTESQLQAATLSRGLGRQRFAVPIQAAGWSRFRKEFRYLGYDLTQLAWSRMEERWLSPDRSLRFIARPYLDCHVLIASAHLTADYAGHRLGTGPLPSPFENVRFVHTGSRLINVRNRAGADRHFRSNMRLILDTFAVVVLRNILEDRTTVLVSKQRSKRKSAEYLGERLARWGIEARFLVDDSDVPPEVPDPRIIPILHYGIMGINAYEAYESLYCLNSYYISDKILNKAVQEYEPAQFRKDLEIQTGPDRRRRVRMVERASSDKGCAWLGSVYLRKLEVDPVIQVAGRVRFATSPCEVVFQQMDDLSPDAPGVEEVSSMAELREALGVPNARAIDEALEGYEVLRLRRSGLSVEQTAMQLKIKRATLYRRLGALKRLTFPYSSLLREFETPAVSALDEGGPS